MPLSCSIQPNKKVAIIQSNYIPWIGYFALMYTVDLFVVYECVQYTKNDWRNRNQIQSKDGHTKWLSIPVRQYSFKQRFMDAKVSSNVWAQSHYSTLRHNFSRLKGWPIWQDDIKKLYERAEKIDYLYEINRIFLNWVINALEIRTQIIFLESYPEFKDPNERLVSILQNYGATHYLSGPAGKNYIKPQQFQNAKINIDYVNYDQLLRHVLLTTHPVKAVSVMQCILEGNHEFKCY